MVVMAAGVAAIGYVFVRYRSRVVGGLVWRWLSIRGRALSARERVLIVGGGEAGQFMAWLLHSARGSDAFHAVGFVDDDLYKQGTRIQGLPVIGRRADIPQLVARHDIGLIVFAIHNIPPEERTELLEFCASTPAQVVVMPDILGILDSVMQQASEKEPKGQVYEPFESLVPCETCLSRVTPLKLGSWLTELETSAQAGDLKAINKHIEVLREQLQGNDQYDSLAGRSAGGEIHGSAPVPETGV